MKRLFAAMLLAGFIAGPAFAGDDLKITGAVEVQYRVSSDRYEAEGDDKIRPEELYVTVKDEIADDVEALIKLDGADMNNTTGNKSTHKVVEEAQVIFRNVAHQPLTLVFGKDEMPFGQDYERFLFSTITHNLEIDKVWGLHGIYDISGFGSVAAAVFERAPDYNDIDEEYVNPDTGLTDSFAVKIKVDKLAEGLSIEASYATIGRDETVLAEEDESRLSVGAVMKIADLTLHAEYTDLKSYGHADGNDPSVTQFGADYKMGGWLLKAWHEIVSDSVDAGVIKGIEDQTAVGLSYYFTEKVFVVLEWMTTSFDEDVAIKEDEDEVLLGAKFIF